MTHYHPAIPDLDITAADCEPNPLLDEPDARNRVDPWAQIGPIHHPTRWDLPMPVEPPF
ncbi:MAG TPA: hypothetical protein VJU80_09055 [Solirubrobacteraceae bacterium]|nr:hypothetical protein [Solirubrobacteraceae bacterium]